MVVGLGTDLVDIRRIERAMKRKGFVSRILTPSEREYCHLPHQVAGRWAAKEAIYKALGVPLTWQQIEVLPGDQGNPRAFIQSPYFDPGRMRVHISISHERHLATAVAILERLAYQAPNL